MGDFRTVIFYKSEDAMDGVDFDNPHQYDTDEGYYTIDCHMHSISAHYISVHQKFINKQQPC